MSPNLNEFTYKQLQHLQLAVDDKIKTCTNNLETLSRFDDSDFKEEQQKFWYEQLDIYQLWQVQIMNAAVEVKRTDIAKWN